MRSEVTEIFWAGCIGTCTWTVFIGNSVQYSILRGGGYTSVCLSRMLQGIYPIFQHMSEGLSLRKKKVAITCEDAQNNATCNKCKVSIAEAVIEQRHRESVESCFDTTC